MEKVRRTLGERERGDKQTDMENERQMCGRGVHFSYPVGALRQTT